MLLKSNISKIKILSDEWFETRCGKLTSSENHFLAGDSFLTTGCLSYLYRKAGEILTGIPAKGEAIETEAMRWGAQEEMGTLRKFCKMKGIEQIVCQMLITEKGSSFGCTPDGVIVHCESSCGTKYEVSPVEVKNPPTYTHYVPLALCKTPQDVKEVDKKYYWQVIDQMINCDSLIGYFVVGHSLFKTGNINIVEFRKMQKVGNEYPLIKDINFMKERKSMAVIKLKEITDKLSALGYVA